MLIPAILSVIACLAIFVAVRRCYRRANSESLPVSEFESRAMHLSTSRISWLTRARALSRLRSSPASPAANCMCESSVSSTFWCSCNVRFVAFRAPFSAVSSAQSADNRLWSSISCRIRFPRSVMTLLSAIVFGGRTPVYSFEETCRPQAKMNSSA